MPTFRSQSKHHRDSGLLRITKGLIAGLIATLPMTMVMELLRRFLPRWQQYSLPPREITIVIADRVGLDKLIGEEPQASLATNLTHYGYGAASGALYGLLAPQERSHSVLKGTLAGSILFALGYMGWIPALNVMPGVNKQPKPRVGLVLVGHLVWGIVTTLVIDLLAGKKIIG